MPHPLSPRLLPLYQAALARGDLRPDAAQADAVIVLENFMQQLHGYNPSPGGLWASLGVKWGRKRLPHSGLYLYGDVGRGKSMLMDMFYSAVPIARKRRVHFHQFMLEIHQRLHHLQDDLTPDVLPRLARELASETWLLCFDEFHVSNIADAMLLGRLFEALFDEGVVVITTSNWPPDELYKNGLQRERFLPFIDLIKRRMIIYCLNGAVDHRYEQLRDLQTYFHPLGDEATRQLQGIFMQLTDEALPEQITLPVQGRVVKITHAAKGVGFFNFNELCVFDAQMAGAAKGRNVDILGVADYLAIAQCLHTVILDGVPQFDVEKRNEILRFMNLIDALYEARVKFFMASATTPEKLLTNGELAFPFQRTVSRLAEMQGETYRRQAHVAPGV